MNEAERTFAAIAAVSPDEAFNSLLVAVEDHTEVHRVVLPYRAWALLDVVGKEQVHTMLRQSVRYCVQNERAGNHAAQADGSPGPLAAAVRPVPPAEDIPRHEAARRRVGRVDVQDDFRSRARNRPPRRWPRAWPMGLTRAISAKRLPWLRISSSFADAGRPDAGPRRASLRGVSTATRLASTRATRSTPGGTWCAWSTRGTRPPA